MNVLIVEDDGDIGNLFAVLFQLAGHGYEVVRAPLDVTDKQIMWADSVLADWSMPNQNGCDFLGRVRELKPKVRRILCTAYKDVHCGHADMIISKPINIKELVSRVTDL